jgi:hypothetical protein
MDENFIADQYSYVPSLVPMETQTHSENSTWRLALSTYFDNTEVIRFRVN